MQQRLLPKLADRDVCGMTDEQKARYDQQVAKQLELLKANGLTVHISLKGNVEFRKKRV